MKMSEVFHVNRRIEQLGAEPGDMVVFDPSDPDGTVTLVRERGMTFMGVLARNADALTPVSSPRAEPVRWGRRGGCGLRRRGPSPSRPYLRLI